MRLLIALLPLVVAFKCPKSGFIADSAHTTQCGNTRSDACKLVQTFLLTCKNAGYDVEFDTGSECCIKNTAACKSGTIPSGGTPESRCVYINEQIAADGGDYAIVELAYENGSSRFTQWVSTSDCSGSPQNALAGGKYVTGKLKLNSENETWLWVGIAGFCGAVLLLIANKLY